MIEVKCSHCNRLHKVKEEYGGRTAKCSCGTRFNIPSVGTELIIAAHEEASTSRVPMQAPRRETKTCPLCGEDVALLAKKCKHCGEILDPTLRELQEVKRDLIQLKASPNNTSFSAAGSSQKSKLAAGLLGFFLGALGVHNFYLGFHGKAIAQLIMTLSVALWPISGLWAFVESIMILTGSISKDANGIPLK